MKLPKWMRRNPLSLPPWAKVKNDAPAKVSIVLEADTDLGVKDWLQLLGNPTPDQYWLEVCYQCMKMDLQAALMRTEYDPRSSGKSAEFHFTRAEQWALKKFPKGKGIAAATQGREARAHYKRIRGSLPM